MQREPDSPVGWGRLCGIQNAGAGHGQKHPMWEGHPISFGQLRLPSLERVPRRAEAPPEIRAQVLNCENRMFRNVESGRTGLKARFHKLRKSF